MAFIRSEPAMMSKPAKDVNSSISSQLSNAPVSASRTFSVRCKEVVAGSWPTTSATPWSSFGTSLAGMRNSNKTATTPANSATPSQTRSSRKPTPQTKPRVTCSKPGLNTRNGASTGLATLSINRAHMAGVNVSATIPDTTTEIAMVTANCR